MAGVHSKLSASGMYRWEACPGSVRLCANLPSTSSEAAQEGTRLHDLGEKALRTGCSAGDLTVVASEQDAIELYVDTVMDDFVQIPGPAKMTDVMRIEHSFDLSDVYPDCFGTADCVLYDPARWVLHVYDFKYGKTPVDPVENSQLLYYALGAAVTLGLPIREVECTIIQPRSRTKSGRVRRWRFHASYLFEFEERLVRAAHRTEDPNAPLVVGRHCFFCTANQANKCPAVSAAALAKAKEEFDEIPVSSTVFEDRPIVDIFG